MESKEDLQLRLECARGANLRAEQTILERDIEIRRLDGLVVDEAAKVETLEAALRSHILVIKELENNVRRITEFRDMWQGRAEAKCEEIKRADSALVNINQRLSEERRRLEEVSGEKRQLEANLATAREAHGKLQQRKDGWDRLREIYQTHARKHGDLLGPDEPAQSYSERVEALLESLADRLVRQTQTIKTLRDSLARVREITEEGN